MKKQTKLEDGNILDVSYEVYHFQMSEEKQIALALLEQELGIDLITLFKALNGTIAYRHNGEVRSGWFCNRLQGSIFINQKLMPFLVLVDVHETIDLKLSDYGKTWALTKEELE